MKNRNLEGSRLVWMLDRLNVSIFQMKLLRRSRRWSPEGAPVAERKSKAAGSKSHLEVDDTRLANGPQLEPLERGEILKKYSGMCNELAVQDTTNS